MKKIIQRLIVVVVTILTSQFYSSISSFADEGYITTYDHHIWKGEFEVMLMNDFTHPSEKKREDNGHEDYFSQMVEIEYAPTNQLALEFMAEGFEDIGTGEKKFTGFRYESRYRIFRDEVPLNPVLYAEYEDLHIDTRYKMETSGWVDPPYDEKEDENRKRESILETRLIFSQDFEAWNAAFNWINETDLHSGTTAFGYSMGLLCRLPQALGSTSSTAGHVHGEPIHSKTRRPFIKPMAVAFELFGALGDTKSFGLDTARQEHYFQPSIMFHIGENSMLSVGAGIGLTKVSDNMVRLMWGWMF